jgi:sulfite reductase beta subunit-like hemoprotein
MYQYTEFDRQFVHQRAAQFRDQLERWQKGRLHEDEFRPLRLQNGWYVQRYAPMLRVAVPYGELSSRQLRVLARIAREYDEPEAEVYRKAIETQGLLGSHKLPTHYAHFSTRQNVQYNWIPLSKSADVMDLLACMASRPAATASATSRATSAPASRSTRSPIRAPTPKSCASGARCTLNSLSCRASSRSRSPALPKTAPPPAGTTWA